MKEHGYKIYDVTHDYTSISKYDSVIDCLNK